MNKRPNKAQKNYLFYQYFALSYKKNKQRHHDIMVGEHCNTNGCSYFMLPHEL